MANVLPSPFLFRFALPVPRVDVGADLLDVCHPWPDLPAMETGADERDFVLVAGWNEEGLGFACEVTGKRQSLVYDVLEPWESDGLTLWLDTRNTQNVHRATRFCHQFCLLPDAAEHDAPPFVQLPIPRAKEDAPTAAAGDVDVAVEFTDDGYRMTAWFAPAALHGFDVESTARLGFYFQWRDAERGLRVTTVGREFPYASDPSVWSTLELVE